MRTVVALLVTTLASVGCAAPGGDADEIDDGFVVEDGKEDNFLSLSAREYIVEGRSFVTVEEGEGLERAKELILLKHIAIAWFLNEYLVENEDEHTGEISGFGAMVKTGSYEDMQIRQLNARSYEFHFQQIISGRRDLLRRLPLDNGEFTIEIGRPTNEEMEKLETNHEWYRQKPWSPWKPDEVAQDKKETLTLSISPETPTADAWWDFQRLIEDDLLTIDVHFGWDYHEAFHLKNSRKLYNWLVNEKGFEPPPGVRSFDDLTRTSGPLTDVLEADGREVTVEVRIFYGKPGSDTDPDTDAGGIQLENDLRASLTESDVIMFEGHSGPFFGFPLANWRKTDEGDFDDSEMPTADMPADKYQVVFAEGCDTYMVGPAFLDNTNKRGRNIDVITTTTMSDAANSPVTRFIQRLTERDSVGRHRPLTIRTLLQDLDPAALYGVHGVDDNPHVHPYADLENLCERCTSAASCGGAGNGCISIGDSGRRCAAMCTDNSGCPSGYACKSIASASQETIFAKMCVPTNLVCE